MATALAGAPRLVLIVAGGARNALRSVTSANLISTSTGVRAAASEGRTCGEAALTSGKYRDAAALARVAIILAIFAATAVSARMLAVSAAAPAAAAALPASNADAAAAAAAATVIKRGAGVVAAAAAVAVALAKAGGGGRASAAARGAATAVAPKTDETAGRKSCWDPKSRWDSPAPPRRPRRAGAGARSRSKGVLR